MSADGSPSERRGLTGTSHHPTDTPLVPVLPLVIITSISVLDTSHWGEFRGGREGSQEVSGTLDVDEESLRGYGVGR